LILLNLEDYVADRRWLALTPFDTTNGTTPTGLLARFFPCQGIASAP